MTMRNVDNVLIKDNQERIANLIPGSTPPFEDKKPEIKDETQEDIQENVDSANDEQIEETKELKNNEDQLEPEIKEETKETKEETKGIKNIDEYGNPTAPTKMYTHDEVQKMIRDRLSRGSYAQQQNITPQVQPQSVQTQGVENNENWEQQLEQFIDTTISKREQAKYNEEYQRREQMLQAEFESRFTSGMAKYNDFHQVVEGKPITDSMMLATRGMNDPAAFIYSAAKLHPKELERIANIPDLLMQGMEVGKLEERMRKVRNTPSAPKPITKTVGDSIASKPKPKKTIDDMIMQHAKTKFRR